MSADLDREIDRAVREMLDVEPPAGLRARVMARIEDPAASAFTFTQVASAFRRKSTWIAVAAAAVILIAVVVARREPTRPSVTPTTAPTIAQVNPPRREPPSTSVEAGSGRNAPPRQVVAERGGRSPRGTSTLVRRAPVGATVSAASADATTVDVQPLKGVAPISVADVRPATIAETEIAISPLRQIADVQVAPLSPPDRRH